MSVRKLYLRSGLFSFGGKFVASVGALAVIWLIARIAGKEIFGEITIAYSLNFILAATVAGQFQTIVLYHVSRDHEKQIHHREKLGAALFYALIVSFLLITIENICAVPLASFMGKAHMAPWFISLSWMIPAYALNSILCTWYRARQDVPTMTLYFEVWPQVFRCSLLAAILCLHESPSFISAAYVFSYLMAFTILYIRDPVPLRYGTRHFTKWDMHYSARMMISQVMSRSITNIVVFIIGIFAPATVVADYSLAMKFGQFLQLPKLIMTQVQMPRMGAQIESKQFGELMREYEAVRSLSLAATILGTAFFILFIPYVFLLFPGFQGAYGLFLVLAIAAIIMAGFGSAGNYLGIAGYASENLLINGASLATLLITLVFLVPVSGGMGAAIATSLGSLVLMGLMSYAMFKKDGLNTLTLSSSIQMALSALVLGSTAASLLSSPAAALMLIAVAALGLLEARPALRLLLPF